MSLLLLLVAGPAVGQGAGQVPVSPCADFYSYRVVLAEHVRDGRVAYAKLAQRPARQALQDAVNRLSDCSAEALGALDAQAQIAYWINAYNLLTLEVVVSQYPIKSSALKRLRFPANSIRQINGAWTDFEFAAGGRTVSLDDIEHKILRRDFREPRIHFAINCASIGCPRLRAQPYSGAALNAELDEQVIWFLNDPTHGFRLDMEGEVLYLSSILDWFGKDFFVAMRNKEGLPVAAPMSLTERAIVRFFLPYLKPEQVGFLTTRDYDIDYLDYDWTLNE